MICPHCGAEIRDQLPSCQMCGREIDSEHFYNLYIKKGDEALSVSADAAISNYNKALSFIDDRPEIYIRLGNAYNKGSDKRAVAVYMKALKYDFFNEHVHHNIISLYDKFNKLDDLKTWYEGFRNDSTAELIDKLIGAINGIQKFKGDESIGIKELKERSLYSLFYESMKKYSMFNAAVLVVIIVGAAGAVGVTVFKLDMSVVVAFTGVFFLCCAAVLFFMKIRMISEAKKKSEKVEDIISEFLPEKSEEEKPELDPRFEQLLKEAEEERNKGKKNK